MKRLTLVLAASLLAAPAPAQDQPSTRQWAPITAQPQPDKPADKPKTPQAKPAIYEESADARAQVAAAVAKAKKENRRVLVQWGANWCGWCHLLHEKFASDRAIARELMYEYDLVLVDVGRFDKNLDLASGLGADLKANGLPFLTVLDGEGKPLANQETGSLESKDSPTPGHDSAKVLEFLKKHRATPLQADAVLAAGRERARAEGRLVFLHFGAPWCGWCHRLEDWMDKPEVRAILDKQFVDVKIDEDRMVGGKELEGKTRANAKGGIPWFAFLDPKTGEQVATSDGPKGNVGFPAQPEEIAHFVAMLKKAAPKLSPKEIEALEASLKAEKH
jgi:thiol-disulfide isomerase/thioredoxin